MIKNHIRVVNTRRVAINLYREGGKEFCLWVTPSLNIQNEDYGVFITVSWLIFTCVIAVHKFNTPSKEKTFTKLWGFDCCKTIVENHRLAVELFCNVSKNFNIGVTPSLYIQNEKTFVFVEASWLIFGCGVEIYKFNAPLEPEPTLD